LEDNGPGLSEEALTHRLEPFFTTKERANWAGIGLVVARKTAIGARCR
jgi:two-component system, NtrC family, C4-dicarboxylate transport sensor histidine kinase DctB